MRTSQRFLLVARPTHRSVRRARARLLTKRRCIRRTGLRPSTDRSSSTGQPILAHHTGGLQKCRSRRPGPGTCRNRWNPRNRNQGQSVCTGCGRGGKCCRWCRRGGRTPDTRIVRAGNGSDSCCNRSHFGNRRSGRIAVQPDLVPHRLVQTHGSPSYRAHHPRGV